MAVAYAGAPHDSVQVLKSESEVNPDSFRIGLELDNGQIQHQSGQLSGKGEELALVQQGDFQWVSPEGETISLKYIADENGYQPEGAHLPVAPPIPVEIIKSIEYIRSNAPKQI